ncbi:RadC family protein [Desulfotalea psychrophila]|uniref:Related to DNA repair protein RadC n=1 Tax=Desulfotalea psychrophila (strain LSv54 / DSM 12343) TaxID=177439 RepID=Q6AQC9_DESPS|nr:DNA repair protein RadC [Desulfotalea psychrophila]CAG35444.1 related to DNA repair protein RadC [Desulfotalea psychrophila LSv54]
MAEKTTKENWQKRGAGHRDRLRARYFERGLDGLSDAEIIELLLSFGTPRADCKLQARALLEKYTSFARVLEASPVALQEVKGVGPKNSFAISFIHAVAARYLQLRLEGKSYLHSSTEVVEYLSYRMRGLKKEVFCVVFLDSSHGIICSEIIAEGSLTVNTVHPRELLVKALEHHAAALIISHNHPSGALLPSPQDIQLTRLLYFLCSSMQIQLLDHIIIGDGAYSFADHGLMLETQRECAKTMDILQKS